MGELESDGRELGVGGLIISAVYAPRLVRVDLASVANNWGLGRCASRIVVLIKKPFSLAATSRPCGKRWNATCLA